jgi:hypothetical protein
MGNEFKALCVAVFIASEAIQTGNSVEAIYCAFHLYRRDEFPFLDDMECREDILHWARKLLGQGNEAIEAQASMLAVCVARELAQPAGQAVSN